MTDDYAELRKALAAGPMPGRWNSFLDSVHAADVMVASMSGWMRPSLAEKNANYIAAANPETISMLLAERDALRAEMDDAREELQHVLKDWNELKQAIGSLTNGGVIGHANALRAERDALAQDAARYRWLRGDSCPDHSKRWTQWEVRCWHAPQWTADLRGVALDDAIDSAMDISGDNK